MACSAACSLATVAVSSGVVTVVVPSRVAACTRPLAPEAWTLFTAGAMAPSALISGDATLVVPVSSGAVKETEEVAAARLVVPVTPRLPPTLRLLVTVPEARVVAPALSVPVVVAPSAVVPAVSAPRVVAPVTPSVVVTVAEFMVVAASEEAPVAVRSPVETVVAVSAPVATATPVMVTGPVVTSREPVRLVAPVMATSPSTVTRSDSRLTVSM